MINIKNINFQYKYPVFKLLNCTINSGHVCGLLGKNGTGKTTLLQIISGLIFANSGYINVLGYNPESRKKQLLQDIYYLSEDAPRNKLTGKQYTNIYAKFYPKFDYQLFETTICEFEINIDTSLDNLSYGNRKKFFIAFAISTNCKLILLDEPTNGIDIPSKLVFKRLINTSINEQNLFIISSHQVHDLEGIIDHVTILHDGKIIINHSIEQIENKFNCVIDNKLPTDKEILQANYDANGVKYMTTQNKLIQNATSQIDLELFFNATIANPAKITSIIGENHGL